MQATVFSNKASTDLAGSFTAQPHDDCPADFIQPFTVAGDAMRRVVKAQDQLDAHLQRETEAKQRSALTAANDVWDGTSSGERPYQEWMKRKAALEEALSDRKSDYGQARSALVAVAARYKIYPELSTDTSMALDNATSTDAVGMGNGQ